MSRADTFSEWLTSIFDRPVTEPEWYWGDNDEWDILHTEEPCIVNYLTRTFTEAEGVLLPYTDAQVEQGLWILVDGSISDYAYSLRNAKIPLADRLHCIEAMQTLFEKCFAARCSPHLSHLDEPETNPLNGICYMWWDVLPIHGLVFHAPERSDSAAIDQACLSVMQKILRIDSIACQESALHGLNHWVSYYPSVKDIIDAFLTENPHLRSELQEYALGARLGHQQ